MSKHTISYAWMKHVALTERFFPTGTVNELWFASNCKLFSINVQFEILPVCNFTKNVWKYLWPTAASGAFYSTIQILMLSKFSFEKQSKFTFYVNKSSQNLRDEKKKSDSAIYRLLNISNHITFHWIMFCVFAGCLYRCKEYYNPARSNQKKRHIFNPTVDNILIQSACFCVTFYELSEDFG